MDTLTCPHCGSRPIGEFTLAEDISVYYTVSAVDGKLVAAEHEADYCGSENRRIFHSTGCGGYVDDADRVFDSVAEFRS